MDSNIPGVLVPYALQGAVEVSYTDSSDDDSIKVVCNGIEYHGMKFVVGSVMDGSHIGKQEVRCKTWCDQMASLRHPNLVQFIGVAACPFSRVPVVVTEMYPFTVASALDEYKLLDCVQFSILLDVAQALVYLHSKHLLCTLTAKDVFLTRGLQAKVRWLPWSDQVVNHDAELTVYYSPERTLELARETMTPASNVYSFGILALHVSLGKCPSSVTVESLQVTACNDKHKNRDGCSLTELIKASVSKDTKNRPTSYNLLQKCQKLSETTPLPFGSALELIQRMQRREGELLTMVERVEHEQKQVAGIGKRLNTYNEQFAAVEEQMKHLEQQLADSLSNSHSKQEAALHTIILPQIDTNKSNVVINPGNGSGATDQAYLKPTQMGFTWKTQSSKAPVGMYGANAVVLEGKLYIGGGKSKLFRTDCTLYEYDIQGLVQKWTPLPVCPVAYFALAIINRSVVLVGGMNTTTGQESNQLFMWDKEKQGWKASLPSMPTSRLHPSASMHELLLIVAGGHRNDIPCPQVEMFDQATFQWQMLPALPIPCAGASSCVVRNHLYVIGGRIYGGGSPSHTAVQVLSLAGNPLEGSWTLCKSAPLTLSCAIPARNFILAVGGSYPGSTVPNREIHVYFPAIDQWTCLCEMPTPRSHCTACILSAGTLFIYGGNEQATKQQLIEYGDTTELLLV